MLESEAAAIRMDLKRALIKIGEMESAMGKLQDDIVRLKNENTNFKNENTNFKNENTDLKNEIDKLKKDNARLEARLAFYGSANMSSSTTSLYNAARKKFRKGRGEKISGNPGEKIKGDSKADEKEDDGGNGGQDPDGGSGDGGQEKTARIGPPAGHAGISHDNKPEFTVRHALKAGACPECHVGLSHVRPTCKMINDLDEYYAMRTFTAVIEAAACPECGEKIKAPNPYLEGTSYGPVMLAVINALFARAVTDEDIAHLVRELFGVRTCTNAVTNARTAVSEYLVLIGMIARIKAAILCQIWIQMDETVFKRGDGHRGYVWLACTPVAVFVWFAYNRSSTVLTEHFGWLRGKPTVCDGMPGYPSALTDIIQRCFVHLLRKAEELAVKSGDPADEARYDMMLELYEDAKGIKALAPFTRMDLSRRAHGIVTSYEDGKVRTHLLNALPDMFTFLSYPGMPPHNNDTERAIRDGIIPQRNSRHKTMNARGRKTLSMLLTFALTCAKQDVSPGRGLLECLLDPDWDLFERAGETPYSLTDPDGSRYSLFKHLDPPSQS